MVSGSRDPNNTPNLLNYVFTVNLVTDRISFVSYLQHIIIIAMIIRIMMRKLTIYRCTHTFTYTEPEILILKSLFDIHQISIKLVKISMFSNVNIRITFSDYFMSDLIKVILTPCIIV